MKFSFMLYLLPVLLLGCAPNPYKATNNSYKKQAKKFAKIIAQYPLIGAAGTSANWVGTTNFSMRKPNFVIIHYTAQNTCDQTLRTFTLPPTQVIAHYVICRDGPYITCSTIC